MLTLQRNGWWVLLYSICLGIFVINCIDVYVELNHIFIMPWIIVLWSVASFIHLPITASQAIACGESITAARLLSLLQNKQLYLYSRIVLTLGPRTLFYLFVLYDSVMHPELFGFLSQAFVFRSCIVVAAIFLLGFDAYCMRLYIKRLIRFRKSTHP